MMLNYGLHSYKKTVLLQVTRCFITAHLRPPPVPLQLVVAVALMPCELLSPLLDDLRPLGRGESHLGSERGIFQAPCREEKLARQRVRSSRRVRIPCRHPPPPIPPSSLPSWREQRRRRPDQRRGQRLGGGGGKDVSRRQEALGVCQIKVFYV